MDNRVLNFLYIVSIHEAKQDMMHGCGRRYSDRQYNLRVLLAYTRQDADCPVTAVTA
jgi:hypothetical protein